MSDDLDFDKQLDEDQCPNCGHEISGDTMCPNCGAILNISGEENGDPFEDEEDSSYM